MCINCNNSLCTGDHCKSLPKGIRGNRGYSGPKGDKGDKGDTGSVGPQGIQGLQGIQGIKGDTGAQGATGATGAQGNDGSPGLPGSNGEPGADGAPGIPGLAGAQGAQGVQGVQGPSGASSSSSGGGFKYIYQTFASLDVFSLTIPRIWITTCSEIPEGCLGSETLASKADLHIQLWYKSAIETSWKLLQYPNVIISTISIHETTGDVTINITGGDATNYNLRVVILG